MSSERTGHGQLVWHLCSSGAKASGWTRIRRFRNHLRRGDASSRSMDSRRRRARAARASNSDPTVAGDSDVSRAFAQSFRAVPAMLSLTRPVHGHRQSPIATTRYPTTTHEFPVLWPESGHSSGTRPSEMDPANRGLARLIAASDLESRQPPSPTNRAAGCLPARARFARRGCARAAAGDRRDHVPHASGNQAVKRALEGVACPAKSTRAGFLTPTRQTVFGMR